MSTNFERNAAFLQEMGLSPLWVRRALETGADAGKHSAAVPEAEALAAAVPAEPVAEPVAATPAAAADSVHGVSEPAVPVAPEAVAGTAVSEADAYADAFAALPDSFVTAVPQMAEERPIAQMGWDELEQAVSTCTRCGLCRGRTRTVFGVGDRKARWLFIGEGPGREEDARGEPFVGRAGQLLDNMLAAIHLARGQNAYIANVVKCRPTDENGKDRRPSAEETAACLPYLQRQIELIQPDVMVALGKTAAVSLLGLDPETAVSSLRGKVHRYAERPLVVTYHPAYLLRTPADKKKTWADLCLAMEQYAKVGVGDGA